jgi:hypothetical protein
MILMLVKIFDQLENEMVMQMDRTSQVRKEGNLNETHDAFEIKPPERCARWE